MPRRGVNLNPRTADLHSTKRIRSHLILLMDEHAERRLEQIAAELEEMARSVAERSKVDKQLVTRARQLSAEMSRLIDKSRKDKNLSPPPSA
jgi:septal ring factor EnvC (AmiA/AmiB activator)